MAEPRESEEPGESEEDATLTLAQAPLAALEVREVPFYGDQILAVAVPEGPTIGVYVPLRPLCNLLQLSWGSQFRRTHEDEVMGEALRSVLITRTEGPTRTYTCLPLEMLFGWLMGISARRVRPDLAERIRLYKQHCHRVLAREFTLAATPAPLAAPEAALTLVQIRDLGYAIARLAEQSLALETRVEGAHARLDQAGIVVRDLGRRLHSVEQYLLADPAVSEAQALEIAGAVKAVGNALKAHGAGDGYAQVYSELYRRYGITGYKALPARQFVA